ncbi:unnamed protein product [Amoebophrya sp. A25]|nr:unnamed protein product [Amoebophrya sp. A25]|eukprot:GSA25T00024404001.1
MTSISSGSDSLRESDAPAQSLHGSDRGLQIPNTQGESAENHTAAENAGGGGRGVSRLSPRFLANLPTLLREKMAGLGKYSPWGRNDASRNEDLDKAAVVQRREIEEGDVPASAAADSSSGDHFTSRSGSSRHNDQGGASNGQPQHGDFCPPLGGLYDASHVEQAAASSSDILCGFPAAEQEQVRRRPWPQYDPAYALEDFWKFDDQGDVGERKHFLDVCYSMLAYEQSCLNDLQENIMQVFDNFIGPEERSLLVESRKPDYLLLQVNSDGSVSKDDPPDSAAPSISTSSGCKNSTTAGRLDIDSDPFLHSSTSAVGGADVDVSDSARNISPDDGCAVAEKLLTGVTSAGGATSSSGSQRSEKHDWPRALAETRKALVHEENTKCAIEWNTVFFEQVLRERPDLPQNFCDVGVPDAHRVKPENMSKTSSTLRQIVRDWSAEGREEREKSYRPLLDALQRYLPLTEEMKSGGRPPFDVLVPGSGLGRLLFEVVNMGYSGQGNEFSYHMLLVSDYILNSTSETECEIVYPFATTYGDQVRNGARLRRVQFPDVCPGVELAKPGRNPNIQFGMAAGEFVEIYRRQPERWHAVLTCFFLDTARNVIQYIRTLALIIPRGGMWGNLGPLLYHFAESPDEHSIELSYTDLLPIIRQYFDVKEESILRDCGYVNDKYGARSSRYHARFFVCVRNSTPVTGTSNPTYTRGE